MPLEAPIILIHGPNGAGKTSVLSALELVLTGDIAAMRRADKNFCHHLVHQGSKSAIIKLTGLDPSSGHNQANTVRIENGRIIDEGILDKHQAGFFTERCYLAQSTLGRLLEIYQHSDPQKDSPLTKFVKDLLGLDELDALIDGLHDAEDLRRTRKLVYEFQNTEERIKKLRNDHNTATKNIETFTDQLTNEKNLFIELIRCLPQEICGANPPIHDLQQMRNLLESSSEEDTLISLAQYKRELSSIRKSWESLPNDFSAKNRSNLEEEVNAVTLKINQWQKETGSKLENILDKLRDFFPDLPSYASTNPDHAYKTAIDRVNLELNRIISILERNELLVSNLEKLNADIVRIEDRTKLIDEQIINLSSNANDLSRLLAALTPHINNNDCPVCSRNFSETSQESLIGHVQKKITYLTQQASRLSSLATERSELARQLAKLCSDRQDMENQRINDKDKIDLQERQAKLKDTSASLSGIEAEVALGFDLLHKYSIAQQRLSEFRSSDRLTTDLRINTVTLCEKLNQPNLLEAESLTSVLERLLEFLLTEEQRISKLKYDRLNALVSCNAFMEIEKNKQLAEVVATKISGELSQAENAFKVAERVRKQAKEIAQAAKDARTAIVQRVFNESLNSLWRDLFIRLAPTEPFIPSFRLPNSSEGVVAMLETKHRLGANGGAPGAMLSAGNLNTAALTLFLALHLSVDPKFPWLVLDDPIQSMDEVHIAQFAALLRTLSKSHGRKIMIAVHDRPLFDYLALELSPAFPGDRLATVQLSRSNADVTNTETNISSFEKDEAIAA